MKTLRHALRNLSSIAILALGIGMSVAMFSLVDAVLLRPLPFPKQESIQVIWKADPLAGTHVEELAYPELRDLQANIPDFEYVAVMPTSLYGYARVLQRDGAAPVQIESAPVSHDFFRVLGIAPVLGRGFSSSDEHVGAAPVVVISDEVWREQLGAAPDIIGRMIRLNGQGSTVIGVMARGAEFPGGAGMWVPLGIEARVVERRGASFLQAIARVTPGVPRERVLAEVNALFVRLAAEHPEVYSRSQRGVVTPLVEYWAGSARLHLWVMLGASLLLLGASIVSAGNLLLSRMLARRFEFATRLALGARRGQIMAQLGMESAVVAVAAALAGLAVAQAAIRFLVRLAPPDIPRLSEAGLNIDGFWFAAGAAIVAAIACTVMPGWTAARMRLESVLRQRGARTSLRDVFVVAQAAVTVMLLAMASLLVLSYRSMMNADIGFANRDAVSMNLQLRGPGLFSSQAYDLKARRLFYAELLKKLREASGVTSVAAVLLRPLEGTIGWDVPYEFEFEARGKPGRVLPKVNYEVVTPDYFRTVGTPLLEGRDFSERDVEGADPVVIVSETLARKVRAAGHEPVGYRVRIGGNVWSKVVGVAGEARYRSITQQGADIFVPNTQATPSTNYLVIRGTRSAGDLATLVRATLAGIDPNQAVAGVETLGELIDRNSARHRFNMTLLVWFGVCAAILAASGVYSVVGETMASREREVAIRSALGAQRGRLVREMVSRTIGFVLLGELAGMGVVLGLGKLESGVLYGVSAHDPRVSAVIVTFLFVTSVAAAFWPAWSTAGKDLRASLQGR
jgi:putative ABC transport system permease protein